MGLLLLGSVSLAACSSKSTANGDSSEAYKEIGSTFEESQPESEAREPVEGAALGGLSAADAQRFETLVDKLPSPCGKAHSLRTSRNSDEECARAPFAVDFVVQLLADGANNRDVEELYELRYGNEAQKKHDFELSLTPHKGPSDAPVVIVEFFDYGCPACATFKPMLEEVVAAFPTDAALYHKMYPLAGHPDSGPAAQAALAAAAQGKFAEMHDLLFKNMQAHKPDDLRGYAEAIGLDMKRYEADFAAASERVASDRKEGDAAGLQGTPTLFINGKLYQGPDAAKYLKLWIEEELAAQL